MCVRVAQRIYGHVSLKPLYSCTACFSIQKNSRAEGTSQLQPYLVKILPVKFWLSGSKKMDWTVILIAFGSIKFLRSLHHFSRKDSEENMLHSP